MVYRQIDCGACRLDATHGHHVHAHDHFFGSFKLPYGAF